jgi:tRNA(fMet)-specific endonuclease VapC
MILLDTDVLIEILEKRSEKGEELYSTVIETGESVCTTSINLHELLYGLKKYNKSTKTLLQFPVLDYSKDDARVSSDIESQLEKKGNSIRRTDAMIAAIAINKSVSLLTLDNRHYAAIAAKFPLKLYQLGKEGKS